MMFLNKCLIQVGGIDACEDYDDYEEASFNDVNKGYKDLVKQFFVSLDHLANVRTQLVVVLLWFHFHFEDSV